MKQEGKFFVGQRVLVVCGTMGTSKFISKITKITPTGLIAVEGRSNKYKPNGRYYKDYWNSSHIEPLTDKSEKEVKARELVDVIARGDLAKLSFEALQAIVNIIKSETVNENK